MSTIYLLIVPVTFIMLPGLVALLAPEVSFYWAREGSCYHIPAALFALSILIGMRLRQERQTWLALAGAGCAFCINRLTFHDIHPSDASYVLTLAGLLFSANALAAYYLPQRDMFSIGSLIRFLLLLVQLSLFLLLGSMQGTAVEHLGTAGSSLVPFNGLLTIPPLGALSLIGAAILLLYAWLRRGDEIAHMLFIALVSGGVVLNYRIGNSDTLSSQGTLMIASACLASVIIFNQIELSLGRAMLDSLTGLPGRMLLNNRLPNLEAPYAICMLDIDHFKKINDTHGHETGDQVLRFIAIHLKRLPFGQAYRYGGEEFTIIAPGWRATDLKPVAEALRESISAAEFFAHKGSRTGEMQPKRVPITVSIGIAGAEQPGFSAQMVIENADAALYKAKKAGRNCSRVAGKGR